MLFVFTSKNLASKTLGSALIEELGLEKEGNRYVGEITLVDVGTESVLEVPDLGDRMVVLSPHRASSGIPAFTTHTPGNPGPAEFGGKEKTLNVSMPSLSRSFLGAFQNHLPEGFEGTYEVDHHGPTISSPITFVELGSTEREWKNKEYAKSLIESLLEGLKEKRKYEVFVGFGGNHYATKFTSYALEEEAAFSHLIPKYALDHLDENVFEQSITKSEEKVKAIILDKKGMNGKQRQKILSFAEDFGIEVVKI